VKLPIILTTCDSWASCFSWVLLL